MRNGQVPDIPSLFRGTFRHFGVDVQGWQRLELIPAGKVVKDEAKISDSLTSHNLVFFFSSWTCFLAILLSPADKDESESCGGNMDPARFPGFLTGPFSPVCCKILKPGSFSQFWTKKWGGRSAIYKFSSTSFVFFPRSSLPISEKWSMSNLKVRPFCACEQIDKSGLFPDILFAVSEGPRAIKSWDSFAPFPIALYLYRKMNLMSRQKIGPDTDSQF